MAYPLGLIVRMAIPLSFSLLVACGDTPARDVDAGDVTSDASDVVGPPDATGDGETVGRFTATPRGELTLRLSSACTIDFECADGLHCFGGRCAKLCDADNACEDSGTCTDRGRCISSDKSADERPARQDVTIIVAPERDFRVARDASALVLEATLSGRDVPDALEYRVEDSEGLADTTQIWIAPLVSNVVRFRIPISGEQISALARQEVGVRVTTEAGTFSVVAMPELPVAGRYAGEVSIAQFGAIGMPLELEVVTEPPGVQLEDASRAWLLLPSSRANVFSPAPATANTRWEARQLTYDALSDSWFASFRHDFELGDGSFIGAELGEGVQRTISVELRSDTPGELTGNLDDRWTGLHDTRTAGGVAVPAVLVFSGTFDLRHIGAARPVTAFEGGVDAGVNAAVRPLPALDACTTAMLWTPDATAWGAPTTITVDGQTHACGISVDGVVTFAINSLAQFAAAEVSSELRASCALAVAETALAGETTAAMLAAFFDGDGMTPRGQSFDQFMADCAAGVDGLCRPTPEIGCARQLLAYAYASPTTELANGADVVDAYERVSREAFLGRQLGAFQADADTRLSWLKATDFPAVVTAVLRNFMAQQIARWRENVLDTHMAVIAGQFDAPGLALLSRQVTGADATRARQQLLFEMSQSWRGAMGALVLATQRWNTLLNDTAARAAASADVSARALDLYLVAGIASNLNLRAGAGFANATFGGGFGALARQSGKLALSFDDLIYARDAEVVVSRSLDPESNNYNLLGDLEAVAFVAITKASESVGTIITESTTRELSTAQIRNRLGNEIDALRDELVSLCGVPSGCALSDVGNDPACAVRVAVGECGFATQLDVATGQRVVVGANVSDAAGAVTAVQEAHNGFLIARSEIAAVEGRAEILENQAAAFAAKIGQWNEARLASCADVDAVITTRSADWSTAMKAIGDDIAAQNTLRAQLANDAKSDATLWNQVRVNAINTNFGEIRAAFGLQRTAEGLDLVGGAISRFAEASVSGLPQVIGAASDPSFAARGALMMKAAVLRTVGEGLAEPFRIGAELVRIQADQTAQLRTAEITRLREQDLADDLVLQNQIDALRAQAELDMTEQQIREFEVDRVIEAMRALSEAELAYERDQVELRDRQDAVLSALVGLATLDLRVGQAELAIIQKALEYRLIVQRAELLASRLLELETQRQNVNLLLGSPAVVFAWANRLSQAESELERAKAGLMNWLVAMEYYAVRPFMDQRIQILLARNTYQLEAIAAEMKRLQSVCGGALNEESATVALSRLIGISEPGVNPETAETATPFELFQATLRRGDISVDRRIRLGTNVSGVDIQARDDLLSATFQLDVDNFANLALSCNAKIVSFDVALVGDAFDTDLLPTVSIVYDGTSRVRSCQPGLSDYVALFGAGATSFGPLTTFRSPSRAISVPAGIGTFPSDTLVGGANKTLSGLPLASAYTVVIDPTVGDNRFINWETLRDVALRVNYAYQDFFPEGACK